MGVTVIGSAYPTHVSADAYNQAVTASSTTSATKGIKHGKVTLSLPKVMYDGNRLDITVRQVGGTVDLPNDW
ncbi:hypothetical protein [Paenibacillus faecalis]|uniref:hypothetical protein n=1 Tax=Paenibacillus faecalis TaxID=2079532 RepID=UPI00131A4977|nr:hypothetical protein [Paenibacillus faecalis]